MRYTQAMLVGAEVYMEWESDTGAMEPAGFDGAARCITTLYARKLYQKQVGGLPGYEIGLRFPELPEAIPGSDDEALRQYFLFSRKPGGPLHTVHLVLPLDLPGPEKERATELFVRLSMECARGVADLGEQHLKWNPATVRRLIDAAPVVVSCLAVPAEPPIQEDAHLFMSYVTEGHLLCLHGESEP